MMEPDEKLLKVHHYKTKWVNYVNVHEATCPEANGFHRFHVLPMFICSRDNENHTCAYHLLGTDIALFPGSLPTKEGESLGTRLGQIHSSVYITYAPMAFR